MHEDDLVSYWTAPDRLQNVVAMLALIANLLADQTGFAIVIIGCEVENWRSADCAMSGGVFVRLLRSVDGGWQDYPVFTLRRLLSCSSSQL
jgi:hypothetical protein